MRVELARVDARCADSLPFSQGGTAANAQALKAAGYDCFIGYLGAINTSRVQAVLAAGMAFMAVTFGGHYDGPAAVAQLKALGLPPGMSVFLDLEGKDAWAANVVTLGAKINAWADAIAGAGWMPCLYVGVPQPFTSDELWALRTVRYWRGQGSVRDRNNQLAEPTGCGWCMDQKYPSVTRGGVLVDASMIGQDYRGRVPAWVVA